jgi:hypothetical protein
MPKIPEEGVPKILEESMLKISEKGIPKIPEESF